MTVYKLYPTFRQTFVYILYTKCIPNVSIQNVSHISTNFCIQNVYKSLSKCGIHFVYILYTFCIHQLYISCILCNFCIQNVYTFSVWDAFPFQKGLFSPFSLARNRIYLGTDLKEELTNLL